MTPKQRFKAAYHIERDVRRVFKQSRWPRHGSRILKAAYRIALERRAVG